MSKAVMLWPAPPTNWRLRQPWRVAVQVEGAPTAAFALVDTTCDLGGAGCSATFEWTGASANFGQARRLADRGARIAARVVRTIAPGRADDWPVFDGHVTGVRVEFSGDGRRVLLDAIDGVRFRHEGTRLIGRHSLGVDGQTIRAEGASVVLNESGRPTRSAETITLNGRSTYVFEPRPERASFWSAADAINCLLAAHVAADTHVQLPTRSRIEALCGQAVPRGLELTGLTLLDALTRLAELAGANFAIRPAAGGGWRMDWFGPRGARAVVLRHQKAGSELDPAATNVSAASLAFDHDDARHLWAAVGEPERVESTWTLVAAWNPALEGGLHRAYTRANANFDAVRDVYRRWELNEAGDWTGQPFDAGPAPDLAALFGSDQLLRRRRLLPCLSRDASGQSLGVFVEVSYDGGDTWRRYEGRIETLADSAGVRIADDQFPPDYWQAATNGNLAVRVTASIEGDSRTRVEWVDPVRSAGRRTVRHVRWLGGRFRRQWIDAGSRFADDDSLGTPDVADDRAAMSALLAEEVTRSRPSATLGRIDLPHPSRVYQTGDRVLGISGQGLSFAAGDSADPREPLVTAVRHRLADSWQTTLELG